MKKTYLLISLIMIILLLEYFPFGIRKYKKDIFVPRLSILNSNDNNVSGITFTNYNQLKSNRKNILKKYKIKKVNNKKYYCNKNICIKEYNIYTNFFYNKFKVKYIKNNM